VISGDPFETSEFSIAWAKDHIAELKREVEAFFSDNDTPGVIVEPSPNGTYRNGHLYLGSAPVGERQKRVDNRSNPYWNEIRY
jgi:hypothetical protein